MRNDQDERLPKTENPTKSYEFNLDKQSRSTQTNNKIKKNGKNTKQCRTIRKMDKKNATFIYSYGN